MSGVKFAGGRKRGRWLEMVEQRDAEIVYWRRAGESYGLLGIRFGLTRQRIGAILAAKRPDLMGKTATFVLPTGRHTR